MTIENLVTGLEISRELKELGLKQESIFWWGPTNDMPLSTDWKIRTEKPKDMWAVVSAFTAGELGEIAPNDFRTTKYKSRELQKVEFWCTCALDLQRIEKDDNEANARGKMLIYLIKNGIWRSICP